ncbi:hypothetical protein OPT61_g346 [Boeremia exigua]|uniref:Uncharacterized protein n=1 Tax=Boeremia exigua TaxID=749465 RepID=A0ACC2IU45_9PLEO|nr:hypothetical protein OPT61_g346 [Boeremia exigua]
MEAHVDEMINAVSDPVQVSVSLPEMPTVDIAGIKALIKQEVIHRMEEKLDGLVDKAITARLRQLEPSRPLNKTNLDAFKTVNNFERRVLYQLNSLHLHEHTLNTALVKRLFQAPSQEADLSASFQQTTFGLQGTDSINSVLVSHVEMLVAKVERLERKVEELQQLAKEREAQLQYHAL